MQDTVLDRDNVYRLDRSNDTTITRGKKILDVIQRGVNKHTTLVPGTTLHIHGFVHNTELCKITIGQNDL